MKTRNIVWIVPALCAALLVARCGGDNNTNNDAGTTPKVDAGTTAVENTEMLCTDSVDNNNNGLADCADPDCKSLSVCASTGVDAGTTNPGTDGGGVKENTNALCSDGLDNDGNKYADCSDFSCCKNGVPATGVTVCATGTCIGPGKTGTDGGTSGTPENTNAACSDGLDNDGDNFKDCKDFDCCKNGTPATGVTVCAAGTCYGPGNEAKDGGVTAPKDAGPQENTDNACSNSVDDDNDGRTDCVDFQCCKPNPDGGARAPGVTVCAEYTCYGPGKPNAGTPETTDTLCGDGTDNDYNGYVDCKDFSCCKPQKDGGGVAPGVTVCAPVTCYGPGNPAP